MRYLIALILTIISIAIFAQREFAPIGAEWYYEKSESYNPPEFGYVKHKCIKDSTINGEKVKVLEITHSPNNKTTHLLGYEYLMQKGDTIFYWKSGTFHILYNFALQKGDSMLLYSEMRNQCRNVDNSPFGWVIVDSVFTKVINGITLKAYNVSGYKNSVWGFDLSPTVEVIGNLHYLFPQNIFCGMYDGFPLYGALRCYSDDSIGFFQFYSGMACDSTTNYPEGIELFAKKDLFKCYPNPASDRVILTLNSKNREQDNKVELFDIWGKLLETKIFEGQSAILNIGLLPKGSYFILLKSKNTILDYEKVIKK